MIDPACFEDEESDYTPGFLIRLLVVLILIGWGAVWALATYAVLRWAI